MAKIKLNLVSGNVVEKPLVSAFSANGMRYVVLDNELNGSMGLPIILVCKLEQEKLTKILDQGEWQAVKEVLKTIIAGGNVEYIKLAPEMSADDIFYTQLTLPVPSFDVLKKSYHVEDSGEVGNNGVVENPQPVNNPVNNNVGVEYTNPTIDPQAPVVDINPIPEPTVAQPVQNITPNVETVPPVTEEVASPINPEIPTNPLNDSVGINDIPVSPVLNNIVMPETPIEPEPVNNVPEPALLFKDQKEAFMQACENMFDALVQKFEKELENRK